MTIPEPPPRRMKLLSEDDDSESDQAGGVPLNQGAAAVQLKINQEFARRFEHNQRRIEISRCQLIVSMTPS